MPQKSKFKLPPIQLGKETIGKKISLFRKEKGYTQAELAEKIGIAQNLISCFENDSRGLSAEMAIRIAIALEITTDKLLGFKEQKNVKPITPKLAQRMRKIETLAPAQQKMIIKTVDALLVAAEK